MLGVNCRLELIEILIGIPPQHPGDAMRLCPDTHVLSHPQLTTRPGENRVPVDPSRKLRVMAPAAALLRAATYIPQPNLPRQRHLKARREVKCGAVALIPKCRSCSSGDGWQHAGSIAAASPVPVPQQLRRVSLRAAREQQRLPPARALSPACASPIS